MPKDKKDSKESNVDSRVTEALDNYLLLTLQELWNIISDPTHIDHKRFKLDALKLLLQYTAPKRIETKPVVEEPKNDISVQIANLFHGDSLGHERGNSVTKAIDKKTIEIEHQTSDKDDKDDEEE